MRLLDHVLGGVRLFFHSLISVEAVFENLPEDDLVNAGQRMSSPCSEKLTGFFERGVDLASIELPTGQRCLMDETQAGFTYLVLVLGLLLFVNGDDSKSAAEVAFLPRVLKVVVVTVSQLSQPSSSSESLELLFALLLWVCAAGNERGPTSALISVPADIGCLSLVSTEFVG